MVRNRYTVLFMCCAALGILAAVYLFQSEERRVKKRFKSLSEWVSKSQGEDNFTRARKTLGLATLFAPECILESHIDSVWGSYTPQEISGLAAQGRSRFSELSLRFHDLEITFPVEESAEALLTAQLSGELTNGDRVDDTLELECSLRKIEKKWLFTSFQVVEVLQK